MGRILKALDPFDENSGDAQQRVQMARRSCECDQYFHADKTQERAVYFSSSILGYEKSKPAVKPGFARS